MDQTGQTRPPAPLAGLPALWRRLAQLLRPGGAGVCVCRWCGRPAGRSTAVPGLCRSCYARIGWILGPVCRRCGKPLREPGICHDCASRTVPFVACRAVAVYDGVWREMIHALKFAGRTELAEVLAGPMASLARRLGYPRRWDVLVPVPIAPARRVARGYNQAELLARWVGRWTGLPVQDVLYRPAPARPELPQSLKGARQRRRSLRGAFQVVDASAVRGRVVAVVDDVYTTGATMDEASRALRRAGAREVWGLVAAVGVSDRELGG